MPDHWHETTLGEVAALNSESVRGQDEGFKFRYVDIGSVSASSGISTDSLESHELGTAPSRAQRIIRSADVLVSTVRPNLRAFAQVPAELDGEVASTGFAVVRARDRVEPGFVWVLVRSEAFVGHLIERATGSNYPAVKSADVGSFAFALPPLQEQRRIVDLVRSIDTYIDSLETQIETTRTARSALLSELLSNPGDDWKETTLGEVGEVNPKEAPLAEDAPFVPMDAVNVGQRWVEYTEPRGTRSGARARAGDVLFARITPCLENGKTAQVQREIDRCGGSTEFIVLRGTERLDPDFLYFWATDRNVRERAANLMTGSTGRQRLSPKDLASMTLSVPPISEQRRIVDLVGSFDEQISSLESQVESVRALRSGVLSELLSGERLLDDSYDRAVGL